MKRLPRNVSLCSSFGFLLCFSCMAIEFRVPLSSPTADDERVNREGGGGWGDEKETGEIKSMDLIVEPCVGYRSRWIQSASYRRLMAGAWRGRRSVSRRRAISGHYTTSVISLYHLSFANHEALSYGCYQLANKKSSTGNGRWLLNWTVNGLFFFFFFLFLLFFFVPSSSLPHPFTAWKRWPRRPTIGREAKRTQTANPSRVKPNKSSLTPYSVQFPSRARHATSTFCWLSINFPIRVLPGW